MAEVVRTPIGPNAPLPRRRSLDERLFVRWPHAWALFAQAGTLLPPRSRVRRALLRRAVLSGWAAWTRGDVDLMLVRFAPNYHFEPPREWLAAGMRSAYRGHAGLRDWAADMREAWERIDPTPLEVVDAGDVLVVLGKYYVRARGSGVEFDSPIAFVWWAERGLIVRQRDFLDWDEALRAAGIPTTALGTDRLRVTSTP